MRQHLARYRDAFVQIKEWFLGPAVGHSDDQLGKQPSRTSDEVFMAARQRIKRAWIHRDHHSCLPLTVVRLKLGRRLCRIRMEQIRVHTSGACVAYDL